MQNADTQAKSAIAHIAFSQTHGQDKIVSNSTN